MCPFATQCRLFGQCGELCGPRHNECARYELATVVGMTNVPEKMLPIHYAAVWSGVRDFINERLVA